MKAFFSRFPAGLLVLLLSLRMPAVAQAPAWRSAQAVAVATAVVTQNHSEVRATAVDAAGNVYLTGEFTKTVVLGGSTLTSLGSNDVFVAKFSPASNKFVWAQRAGGTENDRAGALAVSGTSVYVAGLFESPTADFGPATLTSAGNSDVFIAKLTDAGDTGGFVWAQRAGGDDFEKATALAVSGTTVYVAGDFQSSTAEVGSATLTKVGERDAFVARLDDAGPTGSFAWAQRAGGAEASTKAQALAVNGTAVYMAGSFEDHAADFGPATLTNAGGTDVFVAKLTDAGSFAWTQRAGGTEDDEATALAVSGTSVYVAGDFTGPTATFGSVVLASAGESDMFVAKLTDAGPTGSFVWAQRAGGTDYDNAHALALRGRSVYVAGNFTSPTASFGPATLTDAGYFDVFVAKLIDAGPTGSFAWAQRAGNKKGETAAALVLSGTSVYVAGSFSSSTTNFGPAALVNPTPNTYVGFLATLTDPTLPAATAAGAR